MAGRSAVGSWDSTYAKLSLNSPPQPNAHDSITEAVRVLYGWDVLTFHERPEGFNGGVPFQADFVLDLPMSL